MIVQNDTTREESKYKRRNQEMYLVQRDILKIISWVNYWVIYWIKYLFCGKAVNHCRTRLIDILSIYRVYLYLV